MKISETLIVNNLIKKEYDVFEEFYYEYVGLVHYVISMYIKNKDTVDDLTQEVFMRILDKIALYDASKSTLKTWIVTLTKNHCLNYIKANKNIYTLNEECVNCQTTSNDTKYRILKEDLRQVLEPLEYQVLFLKLESGMKHKEISSFLEITIDVSKKTYREAIRKVKQLVNKN